MRRFKWVMGLVAAVSSLANGMDAAQFGVRHIPLQPVLIENHAPELCNAFLRSALESFRTDAIAPSLAQVEINDITWIQWDKVEQIDVPPYEKLYRLKADLDGNGTSQVVLYRTVQRGWRGEWHYAYVLTDSTSLDPERLPSPDLPYERVAGPTITQFFPVAQVDASSISSVGDVWSELRLFQWNNRTYVLDESSELLRDDPVPFTVYRLRADATLEQACRVDIPNRKLATQAAIAHSGLSALVQHMLYISGNGGGGCGTLHIEGNHFSGAMTEVRKTVLRPWAVSRHDTTRDWRGVYFVYDERMRHFLEDWSRQSAWNHVILLELQQHMRSAAIEYTHTLQNDFGLSRADAVSQAQAVVDNLVAAWIQIPSGYEPGTHVYFNPSASTDALLERDLARLTPLLRDKESLSKSVHDSIYWTPGLIALLDAGADVNARNFFGKTPLMAAAHMNRPDSVRVLLERNADVNARTDADEKWCSGYALERRQRTPLMYAAENAGLETIRLLLDAGADAMAKDSQGNGMESYLHRNPRFHSVQSWPELVQLLARSKAATGASFSCNKAAKGIEGIICGDEVLKLYDRDIAASYAALLKRDGQDVKTDQRAWLAERGSCQRPTAEATTGCLQDLMLARSRYLAARLGHSRS
jgi:uncharacterized protein YecT (DUF1311 family)